jgi:hypothetical protein
MSAPSPLQPPYIVTKGRRTYFVAADGSAWRVRDAYWESRRHREVTLGSPAATHRLFTNPDGRRHVHEFADGEGRGASESDFDRQLRASKLEPRIKSPDPDSLVVAASDERPAVSDPKPGPTPPLRPPEPRP